MSFNSLSLSYHYLPWDFSLSNSPEACLLMKSSNKMSWRSALVDCFLVLSTGRDEPDILFSKIKTFVHSLDQNKHNFWKILLLSDADSCKLDLNLLFSYLVIGFTDFFDFKVQLEVQHVFGSMTSRRFICKLSHKNSFNKWCHKIF